jgi:hypothetical protein
LSGVIRNVRIPTWTSVFHGMLVRQSMMLARDVAMANHSFAANRRLITRSFALAAAALVASPALSECPA